MSLHIVFPRVFPPTILEYTTLTAQPIFDLWGHFGHLVGGLRQERTVLLHETRLINVI